MEGHQLTPIELAQAHILKINDGYAKYAQEPQEDDVDIGGQYRGLLRLVSTNQYSGTERLFYELLQNCDDAPFPLDDTSKELKADDILPMPSSTGRLASSSLSDDVKEKMTVACILVPPSDPIFDSEETPEYWKKWGAANGLFILASNEAGFSRKNVSSICAASKSSKKQQVVSENTTFPKVGAIKPFIGEKGIGFKVVFGISSAPHIFSCAYRFSFHPESETNPFHMVTPFWVDDESAVVWARNLVALHSELHLDDQHGTVMVFPLKSGLCQDVEQAMMVLEQRRDAVMFLNKVKRLVLRRPSSHIEFSRIDQTSMSLADLSAVINTSSSPNPNTLATHTEPTCRVVQMTSSRGQPESFLKIDFVYGVPSHVVDDDRQNAQAIPVSLAFPLDLDALGRVRSTGRISAYLPTNMDSLDFPCLINSDFVMSTSRETINTSKVWNVYILETLFPAAFPPAFRGFAGYLLRNSGDLQSNVALLMRSYPPMSSSPLLNASVEPIMRDIQNLSVLPIIDSFRLDSLGSDSSPLLLSLSTCRDVLLAPPELHDIIQCSQNGYSSKLNLHLLLTLPCVWDAYHMGGIDVFGGRSLVTVWSQAHWDSHILLNSVFLKEQSLEWFVPFFASLAKFASTKGRFINLIRPEIIPTEWDNGKKTLVSTAAFVESPEDLALLHATLIVPSVQQVLHPTLWQLIVDSRLIVSVTPQEITLAGWCQQSLDIAPFKRLDYLRRALSTPDILPSSSMAKIVNLALRYYSQGAGWLKYLLQSDPLFLNADNQAIDEAKDNALCPPQLCQLMYDLFGPCNAAESDWEISNWPSSASEWLRLRTLKMIYFDATPRPYCPITLSADHGLSSDELARCLFTDIWERGDQGQPQIRPNGPFSNPKSLYDLFPFLKMDWTNQSQELFKLFWAWLSNQVQLTHSAFTIILSWKSLPWLPCSSGTLMQPDQMYIKIPQAFIDSPAALSAFATPMIDVTSSHDNLVWRSIGATDVSTNGSGQFIALWRSLRQQNDQRCTAFEKALFRYWTLTTMNSPESSQEIRDYLQQNELLDVQGTHTKVDLTRVILRPRGLAESTSLSNQRLWSHLPNGSFQIWSEEMLFRESFQLLQHLGAQDQIRNEHLFSLWETLVLTYPNPSVLTPNIAQEVEDFFWYLLQTMSELNPSSTSAVETELRMAKVLHNRNWVSPDSLMACLCTPLLDKWRSFCGDHQMALQVVSEIAEAAVNKSNLFLLANGHLNKLRVLRHLFSFIDEYTEIRAMQALLNEVTKQANTWGYMAPDKKGAFTRAAWALYLSIASSSSHFTPKDLLDISTTVSSFGILVNGKMKSLDSLGWTTPWHKDLCDALAETHSDTATLLDTYYRTHVSGCDLRALFVSMFGDTSSIEDFGRFYRQLAKLDLSKSSCVLRIIAALKSDYPSNCPSFNSVFSPVEHLVWQLLPLLSSSYFIDDASASSFILHSGKWHKLSTLHYLDDALTNLIHSAPAFDNHEAVTTILRDSFSHCFDATNLFLTTNRLQVPKPFVITVLRDATISISQWDVVVAILKRVRAEPFSSVVYDAIWLLYLELSYIEKFKSSQDYIFPLLLSNGKWQSSQDVFSLSEPSGLFSSLSSPSSATPHAHFISSLYEHIPENLHWRISEVLDRVPRSDMDATVLNLPSLLRVNSVSSFEEIPFAIHMAVYQQLSQASEAELLEGHQNNHQMLSFVNELFSLMHEHFPSDLSAWCSQSRNLETLRLPWCEQDKVQNMFSGPLRFLPCSRFALPSSVFDSIQEDQESETKCYIARFSGAEKDQARHVFQDFLRLGPVENYIQDDSAEIEITMGSAEDMTDQWVKMPSVVFGAELVSVLNKLMPNITWLPELLLKLSRARWIRCKSIQHVRTFTHVGRYTKEKLARWAPGSSAEVAEWHAAMKAGVFLNDPSAFAHSELRSNVKVQFLDESVLEVTPNDVFFVQSDEIPSLESLVNLLLVPWLAPTTGTHSQIFKITMEILHRWIPTLLQDNVSPTEIATKILDEYRRYEAFIQLRQSTMEVTLNATSKSERAPEPKVTVAVKQDAPASDSSSQSPYSNLFSSLPTTSSSSSASVPYSTNYCYSSLGVANGDIENRLGNNQSPTVAPMPLACHSTAYMLHPSMQPSHSMNRRAVQPVLHDVDPSIPELPATLKGEREAVNFGALFNSSHLSDFISPHGLPLHLHLMSVVLGMHPDRFKDIMKSATEVFPEPSLRAFFKMVYGADSGDSYTLIELAHLSTLSELFGYTKWPLELLNKALKGKEPKILARLLVDLVKSCHIDKIDHACVTVVTQHLLSTNIAHTKLWLRPLLEDHAAFFYEWTFGYLAPTDIAFQALPDNIPTPRQYLTTCVASISPLATYSPLSITGVMPNFTLRFNDILPGSTSADTIRPIILMAHDWILSACWKYFRLMMDASVAETRLRELDLSSKFSIRCGHAIIGLMYGIDVNVSSLNEEECMSILDQAHEMGFLMEEPWTLSNISITIRLQPIPVLASLLTFCARKALPPLTRPNCVQQLKLRCDLFVSDRFEENFLLVAQNKNSLASNPQTLQILNSFPANIRMALHLD